MPVHDNSSSGIETLTVSGLHVHFEGVKAVDGIDLVLRRGEILGLIGPNGAGKTTLVNAISGFEEADAGSVRLAGTDVTGWSPRRLARAGLVRTFQNVRLFSGLSAFENVEVGGLGVGLSRRAARASATELLKRLGLAEWRDTPAGALPYGQERRLGIARALSARPRFVLLDEPAAGLNEAESDALMGSLKALPGQLDTGVMIIEHDMRLILRLCDRVQVLDHGKTISLGTPEQIRNDPVVLAAYLGTSAGAAHA
jgi:branched-chain amino acid transport system ATP-binding protein